MTTDIDIEPQPVQRWRLPVVGAATPNRDPGAFALSKIAAAAEAVGIDLGAAFFASIDEAKEHLAAAAVAARDNDVPPAEAAWRASRLRDAAGKARARALQALDGPTIESKCRAIVDECIGVIQRADLPADVTDIESAGRAGAKTVGAFLKAQDADKRAAGAWTLCDLLRRVGVLPASFVPRERGVFMDFPGDLILGTPREHLGGGYFLPAAHRFRQPDRGGTTTPLSAALRRDLGPGVYDATEARATVDALLAAEEAAQAERERGKKSEGRGRRALVGA